jgi:hypothetical protein
LDKSAYIPGSLGRVQEYEDAMVAESILPNSDITYNREEKRLDVFMKSCIFQVLPKIASVQREKHEWEETGSK